MSDAEGFVVSLTPTIVIHRPLVQWQCFINRGFRVSSSGDWSHFIGVSESS